MTGPQLLFAIAEAAIKAEEIGLKPEDYVIDFSSSDHDSLEIKPRHPTATNGKRSQLRQSGRAGREG